MDAASAPSLMAAGGAIVVARAMPKKPTSMLAARVDVAAPVEIDGLLAAFAEPVDPAIGSIESTPAKALTVPAADSALEKVQDPGSVVPARWR